MSSYILIANAPCTVFVSGSSYAVQFAGERLALPKDEALQIMNGPYGSRFQCIAPGDTGTEAKPLAQQVADGTTPLAKVSAGVQEQLYKGSPIKTDEPDGYTPRPANSPILDDTFAREAEEEAAKIMDSIAPKASKSKKPKSPEIEAEAKGEAFIEVTEPDLSPPPPPKFQVRPNNPTLTPTTESAPAVTEDNQDDSPQYTKAIPDDAHFKTIISYLSDREDNSDPNLKLIAQEIKERFPTYKSVLNECNRILG